MSLKNPPAFDSDEPPSARQVEDILHPHRRALAALMHSEALSRGDVAGALQLVTEVASQVLRVERASVWQYQGERAALVCANLFERTPKRHSQGASLASASFPAYFGALAEERTIAAKDALLDPRTREFGPSYLTPNGISAMLDAPVFVRGAMVGVVCHEHVGGPRLWQPWEELVAGSLADFVALAFEASERHARERELKLHQQNLETLVAARTAELTAANEQLQREIAEREAAQTRVRLSEENLRRLFEIAPVTLVLTRLADQRVVLANRRTEAMFGIGPGEVVGERAPDYYVDPADRSRLLERIASFGHVENYEALLKTRDGRSFPALMSGQRLMFEGEPALLVGAIDISEQKTLEAKLRELATIDSLTGCYNRRYFLEAALAEFERSQRYRHLASAAMLDADYFKGINDRFGHQTGDQVLRAIADTCRSTLRRTDLLGRFGGEEFAVLFVETGLTEANLVASRLLARTADLAITKDGVPVPITLSAGVVERREGEALESLLQRADEALYAAKSAGRNRVVAVS